MVAETTLEEAANPATPRPSLRRRLVPRRLRPRRLRPRRPDWRKSAPAVAVTVVTLLPVLTIIAAKIGRPYLPMQDPAVVDLRVRDVLSFSGNTPLVGAYSHFGWDHPGPIMYYLAAPIVWLTGNASWGTLVAFAVLQGWAIIWTARLAWRSGGLRWTIVWMSIMGLTYVGAGPSILQMAWNPAVALPFFVLFALQCWVVAGGEVRRLLGLAFVASFLVQTHIGYALVVLILGGWALVRLALGMWRQHRRLRLPEAAWPVALLLVLWLPVLVLDPLLHSPSNLGQLIHFYLGAAHPDRAGLAHGLGYLATEFRWLPPWLGGPDPVNLFFDWGVSPSALAWLILPAVLVSGAWWSARRHGRDELRRVAELIALLLVASGISLALVEGEPSPYIFYWRIVTGAGTVVLCATVIIDAFWETRHRRIPRAWTALLTAGLVAASATLVPRVASGDGPVATLEPQARSLLSQLQQANQPDGPVILRPWGTTLGGVAAALVDQLTREGKRVFVDPSLGYEFGYARTATIRQVPNVLMVTENSALFNLGSRFPDARVLAVTQPLPPAAAARLARLQRRVWALLIAHGDGRYVEDLDSPFVSLELGGLPGLSTADLSQLARLNSTVMAHGCLCAVLEFPADKALPYKTVFVASTPVGPPVPLEASRLSPR